MVYDLLAAIKRRLGDELGRLALRVPTGKGADFRAPVVKIAQSVKEQPDKAETPGVIVVPVKAELATDGQARITVALVCQAYTPEAEQEAGVNEVSNLAAAARSALMAANPLRKRYQMQPEATLFHDLDTLHPYYRAELATTWLAPGLSIDAPSEDMLRIFGAGTPDDKEG